MSRLTLGRKIMIVIAIALLVSVLAYADRPTYFDDSRLAVYYHTRRNCARIADNGNVEKHSWIYARMIEGLTPCPDCG